ncbi:MAG TPA: YbhB/YbcL family Raf kinase inhibitor-like protein [Solirubrobacteraceae bacterium]|nr:YbhB/YbcL family Raf kinase inhibitor-like protein [Solirubrobacteraceae bacterium]
MTAPRLIAAFGLLAVLAGGCGGGGERLSGDELPQSAARLRVSSPAFIDGARLAEKYTCDGAGEEPAVQAGTVPAGTSELVLVVSDPDAPGGTFVHLTRFGISPRGDGSLDQGREGTNSAGKTGWTPPCPPKGDDPHRYVWTVYALGDASGLDAGAGPDEVTAALGSVLASGGITARYGR